MKLVPYILIILLLCCTWGCTPPQTIEGVVTSIEYISQAGNAPNVMVLRFEDGRVILHHGWLSGMSIGKNYRLTISGNYWYTFEEIK